MSAIAAAIFAKRDYQSAVVAVILMLVGVRLICAALIPLSFDESYYWIWSKHLAGGYYDHPPLNAFFIRLGTTLFGDTEFGVRAVSVLVALPASWAVWRSATILFEDDKLGATAALYFNLTLVMAAGSVIATHDNPTVVAAAMLLLALAKLFETGRGVWWIAIGAVFGVGMLANYTMIFFAVTILTWLLLTPQLRGWLLTPWPWISGLIALAVFSPTLIWNAEHHWASILYNYNRRLVPHEWPVPYTGDFLLSQIGFATPPIFVLGWLGLTRMLRGGAMAWSARVLVNAGSVADSDLLRLAFVARARRRQLARADLSSFRHRGCGRRGADRMAGRMGVDCLLVAPACSSYRPWYRRLHLFAGDLRNPTVGRR